MSTEQKVNTTKDELPIKTKIAAWWLIGTGVVLIIAYLVLVGYIWILDTVDAGPGFQWNAPGDLMPVILCLASIFYFISGILILAGSIMKCNTWRSRKEPVILRGYGKTILAFEH